MQYIEEMADRQAADAVRARIDWKHALSLELTNVETTHAHLSDVDQTQPIHEALDEKDLLPKEHIVDAGYVDSELLVKSKIDFDIELIGSVRPNVRSASENARWV